MEQGEKKIGTGTCHECGQTVTYERVEGEPDPVALNVTNDLATKDNHDSLYRMKSEGGRVFEPVTRPGQVGQLAHTTTCPARQRPPR